MDKVRRAWWVSWHSLGVAAGVALIGWLALYALPDRYEASADFLVDSRTALRALPPELYRCVELTHVSESLLAKRQVLDEIAQEAGLLPQRSLDPAIRERVLGSLRQRIWLIALPPQDCDAATYRIAFRDANRDRALRVVQVVLDTLVKEIGGKRSNLDNAQHVAPKQADSLRIEIVHPPSVVRISLWPSFARPTHSRQVPDPNTV